MVDDIDTITIHAVLGFLRNNDLHEAADALVTESGIEEEAYILKKLTNRSDDASDVLREAMVLFMDKQQKRISTEDNDDMDSLKPYCTPCSSLAGTIVFPKNVIAIEFLGSTFNHIWNVSDDECIICVSPLVDLEFYVMNVTDGSYRLLFNLKTPSPVLSIDVPEKPLPGRNIIVAGCMGGEILLIDVSSQTILDSQKVSFTHVNSVRFNINCDRISVVCRNNLIVVFDVSEDKLKKFWQYSTESAPTSVEWLRDGSLLTSRMGANHLVIVDGNRGVKIGQIALNGVDLDLTVSFSVLNLRRIPQNVAQIYEKELIIVSTDQGRLFLISPPEPLQIRQYFGLETGQFAQVFARWSHDGSYILANAYTDGSFIAFETSTGATALIAQEHKAVVRCVATHPEKNYWASGSFDKNVKVFIEPK